MRITLIFFCISFCCYSQKIKSIDTSESTVYYDSQGKPVKLRSKQDDRVVIYKNKYDQQNRLISTDTFIKDTIHMAGVFYKYNENKLIRLDDYERTKFGTVHKYMLLFYNKMDSVERKIAFSHKGDTLKILSCVYDNEKRLSLQVERNFEYKVIVKRVFAYGLNSRTETEIHMHLNSTDTTELRETRIIYNEHGDIITHEEWGPYAEILMIGNKEIRVSKEEKRYGKKGFVSISRIKYEYDKFNNWIKQDCYYKGNDKTTTKRAITYY